MRDTSRWAIVDIDTYPVSIGLCGYGQGCVCQSRSGWSAKRMKLMIQHQYLLFSARNSQICMQLTKEECYDIMVFYFRPMIPPLPIGSANKYNEFCFGDKDPEYTRY